MIIYLPVFFFSDDAEFLWRLARACRDLALMTHVAAEQKKQLTYEALEYVTRALEKNEACFAAHKVTWREFHVGGVKYSGQLC